MNQKLWLPARRWEMTIWQSPADRQVSDRQRAGSYRHPLHLPVDLLAFVLWHGGNVRRSSWQPHLDRKGVLWCRI